MTRSTSWIARAVGCFVIASAAACAAPPPPPAAPPPAAPPPAGPRETDFVARGVAVADAHFCALTGMGEVRCWARLTNARDLLGVQDQNTNGPVKVPLHGRRAKALAAGASHVCALLADGTVWCWGDNARGQLGIVGAGVRSAEPREVKFWKGDPPIDIAAEGNRNCALFANGTIHCWGALSREGHGGPLSVDGRSATVLAMSSLNLCAGSSGIVGCSVWPSSAALHLEIKDSAFSTAPETLVDLAWSDDAWCAVLSNGKVHCWRGTERPEKLAAATRIDLGARRVSSVRIGGALGCALSKAGEIACWDRGAKPNDVKLGEGRKARSIGSNKNGVCALLDDDAVLCLTLHGQTRFD